MRVVFASLPAYGNLYPLMPLAQAFAFVGHEVVLAVGIPSMPECRSRPCAPCPPNGDLGWSFAETRRRYPGTAG